MINKDYVLRLAEKFGRFLAIILHLRQANQFEDALIYIDDLFLQMLGLTSSFINSVSEELVLKMISPLGELNVEKCLWIAVLLKAEGDIHEDMGNVDESYYRYLKSLHFFLAVPPLESNTGELDVGAEVDELLNKLEAYELPGQTKAKLFHYFEQTGRYSRAEDLLFDVIEADEPAHDMVEQGIAFYTRLQAKSDDVLLAGNLSREEVEEGLEQLKGMI
jgi:Family of unknown function (DUF6483)